jgi:hypothetical protein
MVGRPFNSKMWCVAAMLSKLPVLSNKDVGLSHTHFSHPAILNKAATEELQEGQCLSLDIKVTRYYGAKEKR